MSVYILIHPAQQGGWSWEKVVPLLEKEGHKVEAPDLPGHGNDKTPIPQVTLQAYTDRVCEILDDQSEPAILVGWSLGGLAITQAAEYRPDKIKTLVYLSGMLLRNGEFWFQYVQEDTESLIGPNLIMAEDESYVMLKDEGVKAVICGDCSDEDVAKIKSRLVPQATAPFATPMNTTEENFGRIPRVYIECLQDKAISPSIQKKMYTNLPCQKVISMNTSHSAPVAAPEELVDHLLLL